MWVGLAKRGLAKIVKNSYTNDQWFARGFYLSAKRMAPIVRFADQSDR